jgi:hypothetical protein
MKYLGFDVFLTLASGLQTYYIAKFFEAQKKVTCIFEFNLLTIYRVLLYNVDAHNVNVTGRVCYLT